MSWHWSDRPIEKDDADTRISFNDVVFGIVIAQIFIEAAAIETLTWPVRTHLFLAIVVTLGSYIGYRKSRKRSKFIIAFFNLSMLQFILDLIMIFFYYRLSVTPDVSVIPNGTTRPPINVNPGVDANTVCIIFGLYFLWDLVSLWMRSTSYPEITFSVPRTIFTVAGLVLSGVVAAIVGFKLVHASSIIIDVSLVAIVVAYRYVKDGIYTEEPKSGQAVMPSAQAVMQNGQVVTVTITEPVP